MLFFKNHLITRSYDFYAKSESICDSGFDCLLRIEIMPGFYDVNKMSLLSALDVYLFSRCVYKHNWHAYQVCLLEVVGE